MNKDVYIIKTRFYMVPFICRERCGMLKHT